MIYTRDRPPGSGQEAPCSICLTAREQLRGASPSAHSSSANTTLLAGHISQAAPREAGITSARGQGKGQAISQYTKGTGSAVQLQPHSSTVLGLSPSTQPALRVSPKAFQNRRDSFILRAFKKKKKSRSLVSHKEGEGREKKRSRVKHETLSEGVLWYKGTIQYERITYVQSCQQHGARCSVQSGAWHPHQGLQTESAVPGEGPGGEAVVAAVGGPP